MLLDLITDIIGPSPVGWEFVPYLLAAILLVCLFMSFSYLFIMLFRRYWR